MNYWIIDSASIADGAIIVDLPKEGPRPFKYRKGIPLLDDYPAREDATVLMDPDFEERIKLYDFIDNTDGVLIVNTKVKDIVERVQNAGLEFLPITIFNHNRKPHSDDYFIINCLGSQPIIDMDKSDYDMNPIIKGQIENIKKLALDETAIDVTKHLFRAETKRNLLFVSDQLKTLFEEVDVKGYKVFEAEGWDGLPI